MKWWKQAVKRITPQRLHPPLRRAYQVVRESQRRLFDPLTPPEDGFYSTMAGDYKKIGNEFLRHFINLGGLAADDVVLDIGCGMGRMAVPLTRYLSRSGRYEGFDVIKSGVAWCSANITPRFPAFRFRWIDVQNGNYNPSGAIDPDRFRFPYDDASFDFIILSSVFTHMLPEDINHYLGEICRVLKKGGRVFATFFIVSAGDKGVQSIGGETLTLRLQPAGYYACNPADPAAAIGFDEAAVRGWLQNSGLNLVEPIHFGIWSGWPAGKSYQDIVVAVKA